MISNETTFKGFSKPEVLQLKNWYIYNNNPKILINLGIILLWKSKLY